MSAEVPTAGALPVVPVDTAAAQTERITRFTRTERGVHWVQATSFLVLLASGLVLALPAFESAIGHRELLREIHLATAFFFFFGPAIVALAGDRGSLAHDVAAVDTWDADDLRWLVPFPLLRIMGVQTPPQGRFNAGQKLNAIFIVWSTLTFTVTGLLLWQNRRFPSNLVSQANTIHTVLAYVGLVAFLGHLYLAVGYPKTRHALHAITQGWVRVDWAMHHHPKWVAQLAPPRPAPAHDALRTTLQILFGSAIALFASRILFFALGANATDKIIGHLYDLTAWPGVAGIAPVTAVRIFDWPAVGWLLVCTVAWLAADRMRALRPDDRSN